MVLSGRRYGVAGSVVLQGPLVFRAGFYPRSIPRDVSPFMLTIILLCINIFVCTALIGVVLIQKSEGGALGMGGGSSNFMSARGTGDLLTRTTWILFSIFLVISITLTLLAAADRGDDSIGKGLKIDPAKAEQQAPSAPAAPAPLQAPAPDVTLPQGGLPSSAGLLSSPVPAPAPEPEKK